ncbi:MULTISPECIES: ABC transporter permease [Paenibacillus]|uniref:ABC transporter permease subunit n=1 Tax=Paenibacillus plantarum TaxID=2654975 RepID=A0ABX1X9V8_9BACL|nr:MULTISPECIES: ABC transporter permease subunit [Paenibacillus]NOU64774.1 ABC transporter permease subunit [Paenibacillus plantarum]NQX64340.1 sugar ABC transporter permease [Paenibacillus qinlingensis]
MESSAIIAAREVKEHVQPHQTKERASKLYWKQKYYFFMLMPVIAYYLIFHYAPLYGIVIAFQNYYPLKGVAGSEWVGFDHFKELFTGLYFLPVLKNTLIISTYKLIFGFPAPIILCLILNEVRLVFFKKMVQTITYLPHFISWVILGGIVIEFLSPTRGLINAIIMEFGYKPILFVTSETYFRSILVLSSIWKEVGWSTIIYLAAITSVDPELYDAADMDGAGRLRKIWNITLPSIMPVVTIMFIFAVGGIINDDFDQIYNLLNASVLSVGDVISTYTYQIGLVKGDYSFATTVGLFKNIIAFFLILLTNYVAKKTNDYSLW